MNRATQTTSRATPTMRNIARSLIAFETAGQTASQSEALAPSHVLEKLRRHLSAVMGAGGFRALLSRALALAEGEVSWLRDLRLNPDGTLGGFEKTQRELDAAEFLDGAVVLLAQLLGLLVAFIGLPVTLGQINEVWPELTPSIRAIAGEGGAT